AWLGQVYAEAEARLEEADAYRQEVVRFLLTAFRAEGITPWVRDALLARLAEALAAHAASGPVGPKDAAVLIRAMALGEIPDLDAIVDKDWLWSLWKAMEQWLAELREKAQARRGKGGEADRRAVAALWARYQAIGHRPEEWNYEKEIKALFARWEARDPELLGLWRRTREWSLEEFRRIYQELDITFDVWFFESEVEEEGKHIVEELIAKGIATDLRPHGPVVVEIDRLLGQEGKEEYRTLAILRSDGTTLYSTKDLALAKRKFEQFRIDRSIYVVDVRQSLYFKQIFKILELWGFPQASKCYHLAYEMVTLPGGKMSSRAGNVVLYEDFAAEARERARRIVEEKNPDLPPEQKERIAEAVAKGVMKYSMLSVDNNKVIVFDWDAALNLEGQTGPYLQYAHARACRILEKAEAAVPLDGAARFEALEPQEVALLEAIATFPDLVQAAAERYKPLLIANYAFELARAFNEFYRDCPVLTAPSPIREGRLALVAAARQTLANALYLLGIPAPEVL
ncbi:MAG: arginine--tRNA ligase, partial [Thermoflexus sp.]